VQQQATTRQGQKGEVAAFRGSDWPLEGWASTKKMKAGEAT